MAQPPKVIVAKRHTPQSLGYNSWVALPFPAVSLVDSMVSSTISAIMPLGLHMKFSHLSVYVDQLGVSPISEGVQVNVVSGTGTYETGSPSYGGFLLGGVYAAQTGVLFGETVTLTVGGLSFTYPVTTRVISNLDDMASDVADYLNTLASTLPNSGGTLFRTLYRAASYGPYVSFSPLLATAQTTAYSVATSSAAGTVTAVGGSLIAGTSGTSPVIAPNDTTRIGLVPSAVAAAGQALFPVDQTLFTDSTLAGSMGNLYALDAYDAVFSSRTLLTLRIATGSSSSGALRAVLFGQAIDNRPMEPQEGRGFFHPSWNII